LAESFDWLTLIEEVTFPFLIRWHFCLRQQK